MKFLFQLIALSTFFCASPSLHAANSNKFDRTTNIVKSENKKLVIRLCVGGKNWRACLEIETKAALSNTSIEGVGTWDEANKSLIITGLPTGLNGQAVTLKKSVAVSRTNSAEEFQQRDAEKRDIYCQQIWQTCYSLQPWLVFHVLNEKL